MSVTDGQGAAMRRPALGRDAILTLALLAVGLVGVLVPAAPDWMQTWPAALTLPVTEWVGTGLEAVLDAIKPTARFFSWLLSYPMEGANWVLSSLPWPVVMGAFVATGWYLGGLRMAAMALVGLMFVLGTGYWTEGMNTLSLVAVSVPLALVAGLLTGIAAREVKWLRGFILGLMDVMQTVPTFAYLTPLLLLLGFGPVVGLVASAIYAAPPMARNVLLGLERVDPEIREAARMSGATRVQQLWQVELPAAASQIFVGVNQCIMAALSMVIIASVIGGFQDIGWEVLLTMRKALFGQAFLAGLVIVVFAILLDRMSGVLSEPWRPHSRAVAAGIMGVAILGGVAVWATGWTAGEISWFDAAAEAVDQGVGDFTRENGARLDALKNNAMFYGLLPLKIGLDQAVLPFTWGFQWQAWMSLVLYAVAVTGALALWLSGRGGLAVGVVVFAMLIEAGTTGLPWVFVLGGTALLGFVAGGLRLALLIVVLLGFIGVAGLWERAMLSLYLSGASVFACALVGGALGLASALSKPVWTVVRPVADMLQTIPLFVFLIPVLMFFQIGEFSAFLAICAYAIVPMIRYTRHGIVSTPPEMIEAARASGASPSQLLWDVRVPYAAPSILLGLNQTILYAFAMLVIAALIGTTGLGQSIYLALGQADVGLGVTAGAAMAALAIVADRLVQAFAEERRRALGL